MTITSAILAALAGYLLGSIPSGMIVARLYRNVDLTAHGSGRTGATNVLRTLGPGAAAIAFGGDFLKGVFATGAAMLIAGAYPGEPWLDLIAGAAAVLGHTFSPWIGFKGGRGVVTGFGATTVVAPQLMLMTAVIGIALVALTRYVSLGSVVASSLGGLLMVGYAIVTREPAWAVWGILIAGFIDVAHRDNIRRLLSGTERKLGETVKLA
ncbi:MAG: glycerol-3-phosphate 1-O-acyltransferase PlsY [Chloroflexi bacterium]|nr:glycerol-3-phosphate 1-O-acyltransferase PlsY [Chloroflexota bacterium]